MAKAGSKLGDLDAQMRIVVLHGREPFLIADRSHRYLDALRGEFGDVDEFRYDGQTAELADVLDELRSYALIQSHKLVVVDHAEVFLAGGGRRTSGEDGTTASDPRRRRALEAYAEKPGEQSSLLLRAETWRPGKLDKLVAKVGAVVKCEALRDADAVAWCVGGCPQRHGCSIERGAAAVLVDRLGTGLHRLDSELAKLAAFVGGEAITRDDVLEMVGLGRQEKAWALQSAILSGRPAEALSKFRELAEVSQLPGELIMWSISDLLRRLHAACRLLQRGASPYQIKSELRLFGPAGQRLLEVARRGRPPQFAQLLQHALDTDARTKRGLGRPARNLEALTLEVTDTIGCR